MQLYETHIKSFKLIAIIWNSRICIKLLIKLHTTFLKQKSLSSSSFIGLYFVFLQLLCMSFLRQRVNKENDIELMQVELHKLYQWGRNHNMEFNSKGLQVIRYGRNINLKENTEY